MVDLKRSLTLTQKRLIDSRKREVLLSGAFGSGKTWALCVKALQHAVIKGNLVLLCRKTFADLRHTTLRVLLKGEGDMPPILPERSYEHNKSEHLITLHGGGDILYGGFDREMRLGSLNLGAAGVDEGAELVEDEYIMILGRLRNQADPNPQVFVATNPANPAHFLYERFSIGDPASINRDRECIRSQSSDNPFLPKSYRSLLASFTGQHKARFVEGEWVQFEGLVYQWDRDAVLRTDTVKPGALVVAGVDEGYTNPFSIVVLALWEGKVYVPETFSDTELSESRKLAEAKRLQDKYHISCFYVDPTAAGLIAAMQSEDMNATGAENAVFDGISKVQQAFSEGSITINPAMCLDLVRSLDSYLWKPGKDEPIKKNDHEADALRYGAMGLAEHAIASIPDTWHVPHQEGEFGF